MLAWILIYLRNSIKCIVKTNKCVARFYDLVNFDCNGGVNLYAYVFMALLVSTAALKWVKNCIKLPVQYVYYITKGGYTKIEKVDNKMALLPVCNYFLANSVSAE